MTDIEPRKKQDNTTDYEIKISARQEHLRDEFVRGNKEKDGTHLFYHSR